MYGFIYGVVAIPAILAWQLVLFFLNGRRIGSQLVVVDWVLISIATGFFGNFIGDADSSDSVRFERLIDSRPRSTM